MKQSIYPVVSSYKRLLAKQRILGDTRMLFVGDPHFDETNTTTTNILHKETLSLIKSYRPHAVVVMGDILDRYESVKTPVQRRAVKFLEDIAKVSYLIVLMGNHDIRNHEDYLSRVHGFAALDNWDNTLLVDVPKSTVVGGLKILALPYVPKGRFLEAVSDYGFAVQDFDLVLSHQEYRGARMGGGVISEDGDPWLPMYPLNISGHIHDHAWPQENLCYVGMPYMRKWDDMRGKGLSLFVWKGEENTISDSQSPETHQRPDTKRANAPSEIRFALSVPDKVKIVLSVSEALLWNASEVQSAIEGGAEVRVTVRGSETELAAFQKSGAEQAWAQLGIETTRTKQIAAPVQYAYIEQRSTYTATLRATIEKMKDNVLLDIFNKLSSKYSITT